LRFYFPYDAKISRAMERIRKAFIKHAPAQAEFLDKPTSDAIHCIHYIGQNPKEQCELDKKIFAAPTLPLTKRYIVFLHSTNPHYPQYEPYFKKLLKEALLIITHTHEFVNYEGCKLIEIPWGYEPEVFYKMDIPKRYTILTTGYVAEQEAIHTIMEACLRVHKNIIHIGGKLDPSWVEPTFTRYENVDDNFMREAYNQAHYVNGLRLEPCFEMPIIEGYACGAQPLTFPHPAAKRYFKDFATFMPYVPHEELIEHLVKVLEKPITVKPQKHILERFKWRNIMSCLWTRICEELLNEA